MTDIRRKPISIDNLPPHLKTLVDQNPVVKERLTKRIDDVNSGRVDPSEVLGPKGMNEMRMAVGAIKLCVNPLEAIYEDTMRLAIDVLVGYARADIVKIVLDMMDKGLGAGHKPDQILAGVASSLMGGFAKDMKTLETMLMQLGNLVTMGITTDMVERNTKIVRAREQTPEAPNA